MVYASNVVKSLEKKKIFRWNYPQRLISPYFVTYLPGEIPVFPLKVFSFPAYTVPGHSPEEICIPMRNEFKESIRSVYTDSTDQKILKISWRQYIFSPAAYSLFVNSHLPIAPKECLWHYRDRYLYYEANHHQWS